MMGKSLGKKNFMYLISNLLYACLNLCDLDSMPSGKMTRNLVTRETLLYVTTWLMIV